MGNGRVNYDDFTRYDDDFKFDTERNGWFHTSGRRPRHTPSDELTESMKQLMAFALDNKLLVSLHVTMDEDNEFFNCRTYVNSDVHCDGWEED